MRAEHIANASSSDSATSLASAVVVVVSSPASAACLAPEQAATDRAVAVASAPAFDHRALAAT